MYHDFSLLCKIMVLSDIFWRILDDLPNFHKILNNFDFFSIQKRFFPSLVQLSSRSSNQISNFCNEWKLVSVEPQKGGWMYIPHKSWDIFSDIMAMASSLVTLHGFETYIHTAQCAQSRN